MEFEKKIAQTKNKKSSKKAQKYAQQQKAYKTDIESGEEDVDMDAELSNDGLSANTKHTEHKNAFNRNSIRIKFEKMRYMLDCGFNLMVYGYGSKADILHLF